MDHDYHQDESAIFECQPYFENCFSKRVKFSCDTTPNRCEIQELERIRRKSLEDSPSELCFAPTVNDLSQTNFDSEMIMNLNDSGELSNHSFTESNTSTTMNTKPVTKQSRKTMHDFFGVCASSQSHGEHYNTPNNSQITPENSQTEMMAIVEETVQSDTQCNGCLKNFDHNNSTATFLNKCNFCDKLFCNSKCTRNCEMCYESFCVFCTSV